jgi:multidrug efflux system membrane fusion protein
MVEMGDYAIIGMGLFRIFDLDPMKLTGYVSERVVMDMEAGTLVTGILLGGQEISGSLSFISPVADATTRTFPVEVSLPNPEGKLVEGLTVNISIPTADRLAHKISPAILSLNDQGQVGVKIIEDQNIVRFVPVTILSDANDHSWVAGLPDNVRMITVGQDFVLQGDRVDPVLTQTQIQTGD